MDRETVRFRLCTARTVLGPGYDYLRTMLGLFAFKCAFPALYVMNIEAGATKPETNES